MVGGEEEEVRLLPLHRIPSSVSFSWPTRTARWTSPLRRTRLIQSPASRVRATHTHTHTHVSDQHVGFFFFFAPFTNQKYESHKFGSVFVLNRQVCCAKILPAPYLIPVCTDDKKNQTRVFKQKL